MSDVNIQFHALPEEVGDWLREWAERGHLSIVALSYSPFVAKKVESEQIHSVVADQSVRRLSLLIRPPDLTAKSQSDFEEKHRDQLVLDIGHLTREGLCQSWLACRTDNGEAIKVWRRMATDLTKRTKHGVTCINRQTGASVIEKSFRYTEGAERLGSKGIPILPPQGLNGPLLRLFEVPAR